VPEPDVGLGRVGEIAATPAGDIIADFKVALGAEHLPVAGDTNTLVRRVGICPGSAGDLIELAVGTAVQLYIGGEFSHHDTLWAISRGLVLVEAGHFLTELPAVSLLTKACSELVADQQIEVMPARNERNPFTMY